MTGERYWKERELESMEKGKYKERVKSPSSMGRE
jgi:hypothetical protein